MNTKQQYNYPDSKGFFGSYGGRFVPPQLESVLLDVEQAFLKLREDEGFQQELRDLYREYVGRPSGLYLASHLTAHAGGAQIYLKREDLNHTGAHKINNAVGQALVAKHLGKKKLIAETGAGQHGVAVATVAAYFGFACDVYMGARDIQNQAMNVYRMKLLGAKVIPVTQGQGTLKDAVDVALTSFVQEPDAYYLLGSAVGPHPYPLMVREFQRVIGEEAKAQIMEMTRQLPHSVIACVGGGSNALGIFSAFVDDNAVNLIAAEPAGEGQDTNRHGLSLLKGKPGTIHGYNCLVLQDEHGEIEESYSAASGLDYPGVGPELCHLQELGRLQTIGVTDQQAIAMFEQLSRLEGIIPALESAHALVVAVDVASKLKPSESVIVNLSGRGDKDVQNVCENYLYPQSSENANEQQGKTRYNNQEATKGDQI
jgi:tryptophan synthase beta subunit